MCDSNYPPGVTGNEWQIAGSDDTFSEWCENNASLIETALQGTVDYWSTRSEHLSEEARTSGTIQAMINGQVESWQRALNEFRAALDTIEEN